jgi:hypothetical protein
VLKAVLKERFFFWPESLGDSDGPGLLATARRACWCRQLGRPGLLVSAAGSSSMVSAAGPGLLVLLVVGSAREPFPIFFAAGGRGPSSDSSPLLSWHCMGPPPFLALGCIGLVVAVAATACGCGCGCGMHVAVAVMVAGAGVKTPGL